jgi:hypothetical protein
MANWNRIVDRFFRKADPDNSFKHLVNAGASPAAITFAEAQIGISFPEELHGFYLQFNGIGLGWGNEPDVPRFIRPIEELPAFMIKARSWFADTHDDIASRFFAFIDWENGDVMGYLRQQDGAFHPFLVKFLHEKYKFDASQDVQDFMEPGPDSLKEFLS